MRGSIYEQGQAADSLLGARIRVDGLPTVEVGGQLQSKRLAGSERDAQLRVRRLGR